MIGIDPLLMLNWPAVSLGTSGLDAGSFPPFTLPSCCCLRRPPLTTMGGNSVVPFENEPDKVVPLFVEDFFNRRFAPFKWCRSRCFWRFCFWQWRYKQIAVNVRTKIRRQIEQRKSRRKRCVLNWNFWMNFGKKALYVQKYYWI